MIAINVSAFDGKLHTVHKGSLVYKAEPTESNCPQNFSIRSASRSRHPGTFKIILPFLKNETKSSFLNVLLKQQCIKEKTYICS